MKRRDLEHLAWVVGSLTEAWDILVLNSPALLAVYPDAPESLASECIAEMSTRSANPNSVVMEAAVGPKSHFARHYGYGARFVSPATRALPKGWEQRLHTVRSQRTGLTAACCLEIHDLAVSLYALGRHEDLKFIAGLAAERLLNREVLLDRLAVTPGFIAITEESLGSHADQLMGFDQNPEYLAETPARQLA